MEIQAYQITRPFFTTPHLVHLLLVPPNAKMFLLGLWLMVAVRHQSLFRVKLVPLDLSTHSSMVASLKLSQSLVIIILT